MNEKPICERAVDLVSYLYGETDERETRDFEMHLRECRSCQAEAASFGQVRESIVSWRDEVLSGFIPSTVAVPAKRSAMAAFRQSALAAHVAPREVRSLQTQLENLIGPEHRRDYANVARSLDSLRSLALGADRESRVA